MKWRVILAARAESQLTQAARFWHENGLNINLLAREMADALRLLAAHHEAGHLVRAAKPGIRRLLLRKTQFHVYYRIESSRNVLRVLAIWHTSRGSGPPL